VLGSLWPPRNALKKRYSAGSQLVELVRFLVFSWFEKVSLTESVGYCKRYRSSRGCTAQSWLDPNSRTPIKIENNEREKSVTRPRWRRRGGTIWKTSSIIWPSRRQTEGAGWMLAENQRRVMISIQKQGRVRHSPGESGGIILTKMLLVINIR